MSRQGNRIQLEALQGLFGWLLICMGGMPLAHGASPVAPQAAIVVLDQAKAVWQVRHDATQSVLVASPVIGAQVSPSNQTVLPLHLYATAPMDARSLASMTDTTRLIRDAAGRIWITWVMPALADAPAQLMLYRLNGDATQPTPALAAQTVTPPKALLTLALPTRTAGCLPMPQLAVQGQQVLLAWAYQCADAPALAAAGPLYFVTSVDQGEHFSAPQSIADSQVVCGEVAMTPQPQHGFALLWRQRFDVHDSDLVMTTLGQFGLAQTTNVQQAASPAQPMVRASFAHASTVACGAPSMSLAVGEGFGYHLSYLEPGAKNPGLKRARMDGEAWVTSPAYTVAEASQQPADPSIVSVGEQVWLFWRTPFNSGDAVMGVVSADGGKTWDTPVVHWQSAQPLLAFMVQVVHGVPQLWIRDAAQLFQRDILPAK